MMVCLDFGLEIFIIGIGENLNFGFVVGLDKIVIDVFVGLV